VKKKHLLATDKIMNIK